MTNDGRPGIKHDEVYLDSTSIPDFSRRSFLQLSGGAVALIGAGGLLAACTSSKPKTSSSSSNTNSAPAKTMYQVALPGQVHGFDPHTKQSTGYQPDSIAIGSLYDSLVAFDLPTDLSAAGKLAATGLTARPALASSWTTSADGKTWTFTLRSGVKSNLGNPLVAQDIVWSVQKLLAAKLAGTFLAGVAGVQSANQVVAVDDQHVQFTLTEPNSVFLPILGTIFFTIFDSVAAQKQATAADPYAADWLSKNVAGYGPYVVDNLAADGSTLTLAPAPNYWGTKPTRIVYTSVTEPAQRLQLMLKGDADYTEGLSPTQWDTLSKTSGLTEKHAISVNSELLFIDYKTAPWNNVDVRQGIAYAMPYNDIVAGVYRGDTSVQQMNSIFAPFIQGYTDKYGYKTDTGKAAQLLAVAKGATLPLAYNSDFDSDRQIALIVKSALQPFGITVALNGLTTADWNTQWRGGKAPNTINSIDTPLIPNPYYYCRLYMTSDAFINYDGYKNGAVDALANQLNATSDASTITQLADQVQKIAMTTLPLIPLVWTGKKLGLGRGVNIDRTSGGNATVRYQYLHG